VQLVVESVIDAIFTHYERRSVQVGIEKLARSVAPARRWLDDYDDASSCMYSMQRCSLSRHFQTAPLRARPSPSERDTSLGIRPIARPDRASGALVSAVRTHRAWEPGRA